MVKTGTDIHKPAIVAASISECETLQEQWSTSADNVESSDLVRQCWHVYESMVQWCCEPSTVDIVAARQADDQLSAPGIVRCFLPYKTHTSMDADSLRKNGSQERTSVIIDALF